MNVSEILSASLGQFFTGLGEAFALFAKVWFFMLPPILYPLFKMLWMDHIQLRYVKSLSYILLEIIPPKEVEKSPKLMESVFAGLAGVIKGFTPIEEFVIGQLPASFSIEMVSEDGVVHFYIRTQKGFRNLVEAHFYAQYPDVEIVEVPDYVGNVPRTIPNNEWDLWGGDFECTKADLYPIRTYTAFEEDVTGKMIDPLAGVIEALGKVAPGQRMWFQLIIAPEGEKWYAKGKATIDEFLGKEKKADAGIFGMIWHDLMDVVGNIWRAPFAIPEFSAFGKVEKKDEQPLEFRLSPGQKDVLKALEKNIGKQMFKVKMRFLYLGRREGFDRSNISNFMGALKQFNDMNLNGFKLNDASKTYANYIFVNERLRYRQRRIFQRYIFRDPTPAEQRFMLSTEELATLFHMPDMSVIAPTLARVSTKRSGAPANLPLMD